MLKRIYTVFLAAALAAGAFAADLSGTLTSPLHQAQALAEQGNWGDLEVITRKWITTDGANWESWYYHGQAQLNLGRAKEAVKTLSTALKLSPRENDNLLLVVADSYKAIGDWQNAEISYRKLIARYPNNADIWNSLRIVMESYLETGVSDAARAEVELISILEKQLMFSGYADNYEMWARYTALLVAHGRDAAARKGHVKLLRLKPDNLEAAEWLFKYDLQHADAGTLQETVEYLNRLDENNPLLNIYLARQALEQGSKRRAQEHFEVVAAGNEKYAQQQAQALVGLGDLAGGKRVNEALSNYRRAIDIDPGYLEAWERIVVILRSQGAHARANSYFSRLRQVQKIVAAGQEVPREVLEDLE